VKELVKRNFPAGRLDNENTGLIILPLLVKTTSFAGVNFGSRKKKFTVFGR